MDPETYLRERFNQGYFGGPGMEAVPEPALMLEWPSSGVEYQPGRGEDSGCVIVNDSEDNNGRDEALRK